MPVDFKYRAFISYSHADHTMAVWLHKALEKYPIHKKLVGVETAIGPTPRRLGRVFRDEAEIGAVPELGPKIETALNGADTIIVLCSPKSAQSQWVEKEITRFKEIGRQHRVLALILDGEPHALDPEQECFPEALKRNPDGTPAQPLAVDIRKFGREDAVVRLVSGILDIEYDDLKQRDLQRRRAELRRARALFAAGLTLLATALGAGYLALKGFADLSLAQSDTLARQSKAVFDEGRGDMAKSLLMALHADPAADRSIIRRVFSGRTGYPLARARLVAASTNNRLRRIIFHRQEIADAVAYTPDGSAIISTDYEGFVRTSDPNTGDTLETFESDLSFGNAVAVSRDGQTIYVGGEQIIAIAQRGEPNLRTIDNAHAGSIVKLAVSPDGQFLGSASWDGTAKIWRLPDMALVHTLDRDMDTVQTIAFSPDSKSVATGSGDIGRGEVRLWSLDTGEILREFEGHTDLVSAVSFAPDGSALASGGGDENVRIWNLDGSNYDNVLPDHGDGISSIAYSPDSATLLVAGFDGTLRMWDSRSGTLKSHFGDHGSTITDLAFSPDGETFATSSEDGRVRIWSVRLGTIATTFQSQSESATIGYSGDAHYTPDGAAVLTVNDSAQVRLWDAQTGNVLHTFESETGPLNSIDLSPDGASIAMGSSDRTVQIWDYQDRTVMRRLIGHIAPVSAVAYSPDGQVLVSGDTAGMVSLWTPNSGNVIAALRPSNAGIEKIIFDPTGRTFLLSTNSGEPVKIDVETRKRVPFISGEDSDVWSLAYAADGSRLITGSSAGDIKEFDLQDESLVRRYAPSQDWVWSIDMAPDGNTIATASGYVSGGSANLWDSNTGEMLIDFDIETEQAYHVVFSPSGEHLIIDNAVSWDPSNVLQIWHIPEIVRAAPKTQVELACTYLWQANAPLNFGPEDALQFPVLTGEPINPETGDFLSPCHGILPAEAFAGAQTR